MVSRSAFNRLSVTIKGGQGGALEVAWSRVNVIRVAFLVLYCVVGLRLFDLMVLQEFKIGENPFSHTPAPELSHAEDKIEVRRADIVDRNGVLLATSLKTASLYADPKHIMSPEIAAKALVEIFPDLTYGTTLKKLRRSGRFVWIKRGIVPEDQMKVMKIGEPGFGFRDEYKRFYPQGSMAAHLVGYGNTDGTGLMGIERALQGTLVAHDEDHNVVKTTLDVRFQHALRSEIMLAKDKFEARGASGIIMNAKSGDVLAMVSLPDFDPHAPMAAPKKTQFNSATLGVYELGSVFKIFSTAALLESNKDALSMTFDAREPLKRYGHTINDFHAEKRIMSVPEVFMVSSNIGTALMGEMVGTEAMKAFYKKLGLMDKPDVVFSEVGSPLYPRPWREINTLTASYGHGIAVSPLQLATAVSMIVNGGYKITPRFVLPDTPSQGGGADDDASSHIQTRIVSEDTSKIMRSLMRLVVTDGTASKAAVEGFDVGGKTGTAEKPGKKGYDRKRLLSSFVGAFPIDDPEYVVFVALDEPKGLKETYGYATAGWTAAPVFSNVIKRMVSIEAKSTGFADIKKQIQPVSNASYKGGN